MTTTKYFLYARKSSEGEDRQITSIEDQISECRKVAENLNIEIVDVISESKSAKEPNRKGFNDMLERIKNGEAQGILCWKLNRLARNSIDGGNIIWLLQNNIIKHIQTHGRDYKPIDNVIMMYVEFGMSNQYVNDLSVDVKRGTRKKAERGWYPITTLPLGYIHNPERKRQSGVDEIIPDPKTFPIVKKLWQLLLTGLYSIADIKREGDAMGLVNRKGSFYSMSSYHYIFSNEFYCGHFYWNDTEGNKVKYSGKHKSMVSRLEFLEVQEVYRKNRRATRKKKYTFPYRGLISCGECNGFVTAEHKLQAICTGCKHKFSIKTKTFCPKCKTKVNDMDNPSIIDKTYYHCTKKKHKDCSQGSITQTSINEFVMEHLNNINIHKDFFDFAVKGLKALNEIDSKKDDKIITQLKKRKTELTKRVEQLIRMRADGEITAEQLQGMQTANNEAIQELELKILSLHHKKANWFNVAKEGLNFALTCLKQFKKDDDFIKKDVTSKLGSNLTLEGKSLHFKILKPHWAITECSAKYTLEKGKLEREIPIEKQRDYDHFDTLFPILLAELELIRTYQNDNLVPTTHA